MDNNSFKDFIIENNVLKDYVGNSSVISIPDGVQIIDKRIFLKVPNLKTIYLPDKIRSIPMNPNLTYDHDICVIYKTLPFNLKYFSIEDYRVPKSDELINSIMIDNADEKEIITRILKSKDYNYLVRIDYENIKYNINEFKKYGLNNDEIFDIINKNNSLYQVKIAVGFEHFIYLMNERIVPARDLKEIYFEDCSVSVEGLIHYYKVNHDLPPLFNSLCFRSTKAYQLELRDRLVSASTLNLLSDLTDETKVKNAKRILNRGNYSTITQSDNMRINEVLSRNNIYHSFILHNLFNMIKYPIYEKLLGYNKTLFTRINNLDLSLMREYSDSLEASNAWRYYDNLVENANLLKNEFCGKILYGTILKMFAESKSINFKGRSLEEFLNEVNTKITLKKKINGDLTDIQGLLADFFDRVNIQEVIESIIKNKDHLYDNKYSDLAIRLMLKIDPYSFDMFKSYGKESLSELELKYAIEAKKNGYLFTEEAEDTYLAQNINIKNADNKLINYIEFINNQISINKIPKEEKANYIKNVRKIVKSFIETSSEEELFKLYRAIDLFLRSESEYLVQKEGTEELAKDLFDIDNPNYNNHDRLLYSMYHLNRLAHDTIDISLKGDFINNYRVDLNLRNSMNNAFTNYLKAANVLSRFHLSLDEIYNLIDTRNYKLLVDESITDSEKIAIIDNSRVSNYTTNPKDLATIVNYLSRFKPISKQYNSNYDEIQQTREKLASISNQYILFFETKNIIQEEIVNKFSIDLENQLQQFNIYDLNTIEKKRDFYEKYGFIMEIQKDGDGNLLLAVYSSKLNEPYSLHMQNISPEMIEKIHNSGCLNNITIAHCKLDPPGLTDRNDSHVYSFKDNNFISSGGFSKMDEGKCLLHNYLLYDSALIKKNNNMVLADLMNRIQSGTNNLTAEEIIKLIDTMSKDLKTHKFLLTEAKKNHLDVSSLLVDDEMKKKVLESLKNIKEENGVKFNI